MLESMIMVETRNHEISALKTVIVELKVESEERETFAESVLDVAKESLQQKDSHLADLRSLVSQLQE